MSLELYKITIRVIKRRSLKRILGCVAMVVWCVAGSLFSNAQLRYYVDSALPLSIHVFCVIVYTYYLCYWVIQLKREMQKD